MLNIKDLNHEDKIDQEALKKIVGGRTPRFVLDALRKVVGREPDGSGYYNWTPQTETASGDSTLTDLQ